jgi:recombination protein RecT
MANDLALLEQQFKPMTPAIEEVLAGRVDVARFLRTVLVSCERNPKLLECARQSLFNSAMSAAVLGLEVDGVTGQGYLVPFKGRAQLVVGYRGFTTLAARSGYTVTGSTVKEGDAFSFKLGTAPFLDHTPKAGNTGRITHSWAVACSRVLTPIVSVLDITEILAIKSRSPAAANRGDSPWNNETDFPAMAEKSAKRRLARSMPLNIMQVGAALDEAYEERGRHAYIDPHRGLQIEGEAAPLAEAQSTTTPSTAEILGVPDIQARARDAAKLGETEFKKFWNGLGPHERSALRSIGEELRRTMEEAN